MGLDLTLLPAYNLWEDFSHDVLSMDRDPELLEKISNLENIKGVPVKEGGINSHQGIDQTGKWENPCYSKTELTPYGNRIKSLLASELQDLFDSYNSEHVFGHRNKAVFNYIKELPKNLPIYLYWH